MFAEHTVRFSSEELYSRSQHHLEWSLPYPYAPSWGSSFTVKLDNDGNATAVILGGPGCAAGESLVSAHMEQAPFTTVTTAFTVLPPRPTAPGVTASPREEVENEETSSVATVVQVEFPPVFAEAYVNINAEQLYSRCRLPPHLVWVGAGGETLSSGSGTINGVQLDNDGNAFVLLLGGGSCASGSSEIEASLESAPYTTYTTSFTILPPQPTLPVAPEFTIEKLQRFEGEATFTKSELTGEVGDTVEYEIIVSNTGNVPLEFSHFSDPHCEGISGGPGGKPVQPGQSTTYTCTHTLTMAGTWTNVATVQGNEGTGTKESNEVVVKVPPGPPHPSYTIEKLQKLEGGGPFTKNELTGKVAETVEYEIIVTNTGNVTLKFGPLKDPNCEGITPAGATELAPGKHETFTCTHTLTTVGSWKNVATIEGNEGTGSKESNQVVVKVPPLPEPANVVVVKATPEPKNEPLPAKCASAAAVLVLKEGSGPKRHKFTVEVRTGDIKRITFYLDGRKFKTLTAAAAKRAKYFKITIDPRKLRYGAHTIAVTVELTDPVCAPLKASSVFVHPRAGRGVVKFTG